MSTTSTPYDDVYRTMLNDCSSLILPVINEMFSEHYIGNEKIIFGVNEHFLNQQNGGEISYPVSVFKVQSYTIGEIFQKKLLFLIPFYIFTHEGRFRVYNTNKELLDALKDEYEEIMQRLESLMNTGEIDEFTKCMIVDMSNCVLQHIAVKYDTVREGVKAVMGGKVLNYRAKILLNQGRRDVAENMIKLGKNSYEEIAQCAMISVSEVEKLAKKLGVPTSAHFVP